ncbi:MAG: fibronectin type III domain-containing protein, partial [Actinomycetota bacterium]
RYQMNYRESGRSWIRSASTTATDRSITGLDSRTTYEVRVRAYINKTWQAWKTVKITTPS